MPKPAPQTIINIYNATAQPEPNNTKAVPVRYEHIDFKPTQTMADNAKRGLELRKEHERGGTEVGVQRARNISNRDNISPDVVKAMHSFFSRHEVNKQADGWGDRAEPSAGYIPWLLWGGDEGQTWARARVEQMRAADDSAKAGGYTKPYQTDSPSLPDYVQRLSDNERQRWVSTFNNALEETGNESSAFAIANSAIKSITQAADSPVTLPKPGGGIKALGSAPNTIGGYLVRWGSPNDRDSEGEYFTPRVDFMRDVYPIDIPVYYEHSIVDDAGSPTTDDTKWANTRKTLVGKITDIRQDDTGLWVEATLDTNAMAREALEAITAGHMFWSSGTAPHLARRTEDSEITTWPIIDASITATPAEPHGTAIYQIKSDFGAEGAWEMLLRAYSTDSANNNSKVKHNIREVEMDPKQKTPPTGDGAADPQPKPRFSDMLEMSALERTQTYATAIKSLWPNIQRMISAIEADIKAAGKEGPEYTKAIDEQLQVELTDMAKRLASMVTGDTVEDALRALTEHVMLKLTASMQAEEAPAAMPDADKMSDEDEDANKMYDDKMITEDGDDIIKGTAKRGAKSRMPAPLYGAYLTAPTATSAASSTYSAPNLNIKSNKRYSITDHVRAMYAARNGDASTLARQKRATYKSYLSKYGQDWTIKALGSNPLTIGGFTIDAEQSSEIIGGLYDENVILSESATDSWARRMPMVNNQLLMPRVNTPISAGFVGENQETDEDTALDFGLEQMNAVKLYSMIRVPREYLADSSVNVDSFLQEEMTAALQQEMLRGILEGTGGVEPVGLATRGISTSLSDAAPTVNDLTSMLRRMNQAKVGVKPSKKAGWLMDPREAETIRLLEDTEGNYVWTGHDGQGLALSEGLVPGRLLGLPVKQTNQISDNKIIVANWRDVMVAIREDIELQLTEERYWEYDQIAYRVIMRIAVGVAYPDSVQILTDVGTA
jgi:HK97 family phage major capsid protein